MKKISLLTIVLLVTEALRADLVIQQQLTVLGYTNKVSLSFKGNMMREENSGDVTGHIIQIMNVSTLDQIMLMPESKNFSKSSGVKIKEFLNKPKEQAGDTNSTDAASLPPKSTGKFEKFGDYETEIFFWSNGKGVTNRLWVAKNYPDFGNIKPYLVKLDEFHKQGLDGNIEPAVAGLPGMVIKKEVAIESQKVVVQLISAKVQPVNTSLFEIPSDYTGPKPKMKRSE